MQKTICGNYQEEERMMRYYNRRRYNNGLSSNIEECQSITNNTNCNKNTMEKSKNKAFVWKKS